MALTLSRFRATRLRPGGTVKIVQTTGALRTWSVPGSSLSMSQKPDLSGYEDQSVKPPSTVHRLHVTIWPPRCLTCNSGCVEKVVSDGHSRVSNPTCKRSGSAASDLLQETSLVNVTLSPGLGPGPGPGPSLSFPTVNHRG